MASYTLNTTVAQETIITRARNEENARGAGYANNGAFLLDVLKTAVLKILDEQKNYDRSVLETAVKSATQAQKDAVISALGLPAGTIL